MTGADLAQIAVTLGAVVVLAWPLGGYLARVFAWEGGRNPLARVLGPVERGIYALAGITEADEQPWTAYAASVLAFTGAGFATVLALQLAQGALPLNPQHLGPVSWHSAFNTATSFATNTNWQGYGGETTMSYLTQMLGLGVQNFVSAASGLAMAVALARGLSRANRDTIGSFWVDVVRATLYVLLPLSFAVALLLVSQGAVQTFAPYVTAHTLGGATQTIALGPAASQLAIKQLGTNGGGFFNANSAHPFENPTPLSNLAEVVSIVILAVASCRAYGLLVGDERQGRALAAACAVILVPLVFATVAAEQHGTALLDAAHAVGGNLEGKEVRFGVANSAVWAALTTATSNGSVNAMHDSFTPLGGLVPLWLMQLGEVVFGGVGSGLYGLVLYALVAVFVSGLMVGRTPEYLGKKVEAFEMKLAAIAILAPCATVLVGTALSVATAAGRAGLSNPGAHGFSEALYAWSSAANNNGSAFGGLAANTPFYDLGLGVAMWIGRFAVALPVLAAAGSFARKKTVPAGPGTLPTHDGLFVAVLVAVVILVGALNFVPALALGPVVEHLQMVR